MRAEAAEQLRRAREEALRLVADGRVEADQLRSDARKTHERARAEVAALQAQRDEIAGELGQLSGVIAALSVPERGPVDPDQSEGSAPPHGDEEPPAPQLPTNPTHHIPEQENPDG